jgi:geranylgeranyl pyrophosphate synthase
VLEVCCAVELLQAYFLIHDDWMDGDRIRRGRPSCHVAFGEPAAILAATGLVLRCFEELATAPSPHGAAFAAEFARAAGTVTGLIAGQARDLWPPTPGLKHLEQTHAGKTGSLFGLATAIAPRIAGRNEAAIARFRRAGTNLGIAFQLADDLVDGTPFTAPGGRTAISGGAVKRRALGLVERGAGELVALTGDPSLAWLCAVVELA